MAAGSPSGTLMVWSCDWCLIEHKSRRISRRHQRFTASEVWQTLEQHGLTRPGNTTFLGGFELLHGYGDCPPAGTLCSIAGLEDGVLIIAEVGATGRVFIPYPDLLALEAGGQGMIRRDAGMIGGGYGLFGMAKGIAVAELINHMTRKVTNDSYLRVSSLTGEMIFSHWRLPPQTVRTGLGRAFVGHMAATRQAGTPTPVAAPSPSPSPVVVRTPIDELERLTKLHAAGTLTDTEFQMARDVQVRRPQHESE